MKCVRKSLVIDENRTLDQPAGRSVNTSLRPCVGVGVRVLPSHHDCLDAVICLSAGCLTGAPLSHARTARRCGFLTNVSRSLPNARTAGELDSRRGAYRWKRELASSTRPARLSICLSL